MKIFLIVLQMYTVRKIMSENTEITFERITVERLSAFSKTPVRCHMRVIPSLRSKIWKLSTFSRKIGEIAKYD